MHDNPLTKQLLQVTFDNAEKAYMSCYNDDHTPKVPHPETCHDEVIMWGRAWLVVLTTIDYLEEGCVDGDIWPSLEAKLANAMTQDFEGVLEAMYG